MSVDKYSLPKHIVTDPVSGREIYVYEHEWEECDGDIEFYFRNFDKPYNLVAIRNRASIDELLEFANSIRVAGDGEVIDELLMSNPQESHDCLIANALNFNSEVSDNYGGWSMCPDDYTIIDKIASKMGLEKAYEDEYEEDAIGIMLPDRIAKVAEAFDSYRDVELEQYDSMRENNTVNPLI